MATYGHWQIRAITDRGPREFYRFAIEGWNEFTRSDFFWSVPDLRNHEFWSPRPEIQAAIDANREE